MTKAVWTSLIRGLPKNLTVEEVAEIFRRSPGVVRERLRESGYHFRATKSVKLPGWVGAADWSEANIDIAVKFGKTREAVRQWREKLGKPKVESRGRSKDGGVYAHAE